MPRYDVLVQVDIPGMGGRNVTVTLDAADLATAISLAVQQVVVLTPMRAIQTPDQTKAIGLS